MFNAIVIDKPDDQYQSTLTQVDTEQLDQGDVLVNVSYSTLNYKDALAITGKSPVVRKFPMVPGIDLVGEVVSCDSDKFAPGDKVLLNGFGVGEVHSGGLAQQARLNSDWLIPLPAGISERNAMAVGTAGYTAMLCVMALEQANITPESGPILVTGATGGVGSFAVLLLSKLGYQVVASTGDMANSDYLTGLGASEVIDRNELSGKGRPLMKERWAGAIDSVGSTTLANVCASIKYGGSVAACGLAQGFDLPATVMPFILRGVNLLGIDSVMRPIADRALAWQRLSELVQDNEFAAVTTEIGLEQAIEYADKLLAGQVTGRVVVNVNN